MDQLCIVPRVKAFVVAGRNHNEPILDKDIPVSSLGITVSYGEKPRGPARLPTSDMNRDAQLFSETDNRSKIAPDCGRTKLALLGVEEESLEAGLSRYTCHHPLGPIDRQLRTRVIEKAPARLALCGIVHQSIPWDGGKGLGPADQ
jgi:hypothetical protein